jgi:3-deoxy-7-phosphoheptulonate synthase
MPIGFKNGTYGGVQVAVDAVLSSRHPHRFLGVTEQGLAGIVSTTGNPNCHVILRGGKSGANYDSQSVAAASALLKEAGLAPSLMVDCSHGNSDKDYKKQPAVAHALCRQVAEGSRSVMGAMIESHLVAGQQSLGNPAALKYGQSITDACIDWEATEPLLDDFAAAVRKRRG